MSVNQNSGNVNSLFNQAIGRSEEPEIDPEVKAYIDDAIDDAVETVTAAYTAAIASATETITAAYTAAIAAALSTALAAIPVTIEEPTETTLELDPVPVTYVWGEEAALTLTVTSGTQYHFKFTCPAAAATLVTIIDENSQTVPVSGDTLEAGKSYECDIWDNVAIFREVVINV